MNRAPSSDPIGSKSGPLPPDHVPDLLAPGLRVVFCGMALGRRSAERRAYYAHPGNRFWPTLHAIGLTPTRFAPTDYPNLLGLGIGLTDVSKSHYGNDDELPAEALDPVTVRAKTLRYGPKVLAFTSKAAAAQVLGRPTGRIPYAEQAERIGETALFVLPSPSGAASRYWDIAVWYRLAAALAKPT